MKKILLLLVIVLAFSLPSSLQAQNLLTNPGFETWTNANQPTGWAITGNIANYKKNTTQFNEGAASCVINATATTTIAQTVAVTAGKTYTLKLSYYYHATTGNGLRMLCRFRNASNKVLKTSVDDSIAINGSGTNVAFFPKVVGSWITYTYDIVAPVDATTFNFNLSVASGSSVSIDNCGYTPNTSPTIYPSKTSLTGFTYAPGNGPSAQQTFNIRASNLTRNLTITPPADYEISVNSGSSFVATPTITIANSEGLITSTPIYVRLKAGLAINNYVENITFTATGATSQYVLLTGSVVVAPVTITPSVTTLTGFTYAEGSGPSPEKSFTISGSNLTAGIVVTAPTGYEISLVSGLYSGATTFTIPQSGGTISTITVYLRLKSGLTVGTYNGNLTLASTGGTTKTIALTGTVTVASGLTVSTSSLSGFSYYWGGGPSAIQSFTVSGTALSTFIIVTPPAEFEISTEAESSFTAVSYLILPQVGTSTTLYVRLQSGLAVSSYTGNISLVSGSYSKTVSLNGIILLTDENKDVSNNGSRIYSKDNEIIVEGTANNEIISIYNLVGIKLKSVKSIGDKLTIPMNQKSVYLVKTANKTVKIAL